eukprot:tig00000514_g1798.t1
MAAAGAVGVRGSISRKASSVASPAKTAGRGEPRPAAEGDVAAAAAAGAAAAADSKLQLLRTRSQSDGHLLQLIHDDQDGAGNGSGPPQPKALSIILSILFAVNDRGGNPTGFLRNCILPVLSEIIDWIQFLDFAVSDSWDPRLFSLLRFTDALHGWLDFGGSRLAELLQFWSCTLATLLAFALTAQAGYMFQQNNVRVLPIKVLRAVVPLVTETLCAPFEFMITAQSGSVNVIDLEL